MKISIVTVVRNAAELIEVTLESALKQSYDSTEIVVVDGASQDGTVERARHLLRPDDILVSEPDCGIYDAMNKGVRLASGNILIFMNAGDVFANSSVLHDVACQWNQNDSIVYGVAEMSGADSTSAGDRMGRRLTLEEFRKGRIYSHQAEFIKRDLFFEIGVYDTKFDIAADVEFRLRAIRLGITPRFVDVMCARFLDGGVSQKEHRFFNQRAQVLYKYYGFFWAARYTLANQLARLKRLAKTIVRTPETQPPVARSRVDSEF